jgi:hypothetical protein
VEKIELMVEVQKKEPEPWKLPEDARQIIEEMKEEMDKAVEAYGGKRRDDKRMLTGWEETDPWVKPVLKLFERLGVGERLRYDAGIKQIGKKVEQYVGDTFGRIDEGLLSTDSYSLIPRYWHDLVKETAYGWAVLYVVDDSLLDFESLPKRKKRMVDNVLQEIKEEEKKPMAVPAKEVKEVRQKPEEGVLGPFAEVVPNEPERRQVWEEFFGKDAKKSEEAWLNIISGLWIDPVNNPDWNLIYKLNSQIVDKDIVNSSLRMLGLNMKADATNVEEYSKVIKKAVDLKVADPEERKKSERLRRVWEGLLLGEEL